jgi:hypothetical protein
MASGRIFRQLRIALLLFILLLVAGDAWLTGSRATDWDDALWVVIYPINSDGGAVAASYISRLRNDVFSPLEEYFPRQAGRYGLAQKELVKVRLGPVVKTLPPVPPKEGNVLAVMWWSLKLRFWAMRTGLGMDGPPADIRIYVIYHDPARQPRLAHSLGLKEGLIGVVNAYASKAYSGRNNVVIAHELLHTLGATDKYDQASGQPLFPEGYAQPERKPLYPQYKAEVMGGRIPLSSTRSDIPGSLKRTLIGRTTAREINWLE